MLAGAPVVASAEVADLITGLPASPNCGSVARLAQLGAAAAASLGVQLMPRPSSAMALAPITNRPKLNRLLMCIPPHPTPLVARGRVVSCRCPGKLPGARHHAYDKRRTGG